MSNCNEQYICFCWVYLNMDSCIQGGYDKEEKAAKAYDLAALKYWGTTTTTNFPVFTYILLLLQIYTFPFTAYFGYHMISFSCLDEQL